MKLFGCTNLITLLVCLTLRVISAKKNAATTFWNRMSEGEIEMKENNSRQLSSSDQTNKQRRLNTVVHTGTVVIDYAFFNGEEVYTPLGSERQGIERITQAFYRQVFAAAFPPPYSNAFVTYTQDGIVNDRLLRIFYNVEVLYTTQSEGGVPSVDATRAAAVRFDFDDYLNDFVNLAEPHDGIWPHATSAFVFTLDNSFSSASVSGGSGSGSGSSSGGGSGSSGSSGGSSGPSDDRSGPSPSNEGNRAGFNICFSGDTTIDVLGQGIVRMSALKVGDRVNIGNDEYSTVYGFGHLDNSKSNEYLRVHTKGKDGSRLSPLEISDKHLIPIKGSTTDGSRTATTLQASKLRLNDILYGKGESEYVVTKLQHVTRRGAYLPLTKEGKVLVNGIVASAYVSIFDDAPSVISLVTKVVSEETFFGLFVSPFRLICGKMSFTDVCTSESMFDKETGIWHWLLWGQRLTISVDGANAVLQVVGVALALVVLAIVNALEWLWTMRLWTIAVLSVWYVLGIKVKIDNENVRAKQANEKEKSI
ncbi:Hint module [Seminavis robusta]|uniref:Hint module n=1 Tax=Seminavis robusta TaxID=568900 RepID=A0A9N8DWT1_9STRA|nr:Hint module [Seminavis robusta]|eukprot:Sro421_g139550.1 Hint module (533) ;mRNA; f:36349-38065